MSEFLIGVENVLQALSAGVLLGGIYGLMCVGLGIIFGVMRVINFAQGDLMMVGMYCAFYLFGALGLGAALGPEVGAIVAALLTAPIMYGFGVLLHRVLVSRVTGVRVASLEGEGHYAQLILTLGLALVLANGGLLLFGSTPVTLRSSLSSSAWEVGPLVGDFVSIFVNKARGIALLLSLIVAAGLYMFITRSRLGKSLRAAADNPEAAIYMGIDVEKAHRIAFGIGTAITAVAGGLVATYYPFQPYVGLEFVIVMYAGVVLGGLGSTIGAFWGGMIIGLVQQLATLVLPTQLQNTAVFVVFLLVVFFRPQGLFGVNVTRA
ncbi:MAG: branched-chain amino acid ABC transporter permease [Hyphomicrobiaceae bacterium]